MIPTIIIAVFILYMSGWRGLLIAGIAAYAWVCWDGYKMNVAYEHRNDALAAECITHPPPNNNDPLTDVDRFLCRHETRR